MKLAMRLPEKGQRAVNDSDPRDGETTEVIDLASRTAYPVVAQRKGRSDALGLAAGVGFVALLGAATLWGLNASRMADEQPAAPSRPRRRPAQFIPPRPGRRAGAAGQRRARRAASPIRRLRRCSRRMPMPAIGPAANPYASPTMVFDASALPLPAGAAAIAAQAARRGQPGRATARTTSPAASAASAARRRTARSDVDPKTTVTQGTMIPAVLETAINTDVPGYVRAVVSQDVRSFDGTRVLVPRSSRLIGQYQSGLQAGQKRAYVIWTRLIRPDGVSVALASPGTGFDGSGGLAGQGRHALLPALRLGDAAVGDRRARRDRASGTSVHRSAAGRPRRRPRCSRTATSARPSACAWASRSACSPRATSTSARRRSSRAR